MRSPLRRVLKTPRARSLVVVLLALGAVVAVIITADPAHIGKTFERFNLWFLPVVVGLSLAFYLLQGVRWWTLNRALGINFSLGDTIFVTEAGQATALLPLGELTRALLLARAAGVGFGAAVATETVQELLFVFMLFVVALP
ncbi:MAG TPA: lysylphosphatidylglycerol synthase domain-containing protein, partial [Candidatus Dormibacteraeota bacterium]|nr:lysylphosphatidylglycerol synthase domain-containing protein [Candidatus Dormibacteraeota bacterium]